MFYIPFRFEINYKTGPNDGDDIAFQFRPELHAVVCNSCKNGKWEDQESKEEALFAKGEGFDIIMIIKQNAYEVRCLKKLNKWIINCKWSK